MHKISEAVSGSIFCYFSPKEKYLCMPYYLIFND